MAAAAPAAARHGSAGGPVVRRVGGSAALAVGGALDGARRRPSRSRVAELLGAGATLGRSRPGERAVDGVPDEAQVLTLDAPARRPGRRAAGPGGRASWRTARWRLAALGLVAVLVHVAIVTTALQGLREIERAHAEVARIAMAQRYFQDADMAHDAIMVSAYGASHEAAGVLPPLAVGSRTANIAEEVQDFRDELAMVDRVSLPADLAAVLRDLRPVQVAYAEEAESFILSLQAGSPDLRPGIERLNGSYRQLIEPQETITRAMSEEAGRRQRAAEDHEREVEVRLVASAAVALLGLLGVTALLHRTGSDLARLIARERGVAETLQRSLLPDRLPDLPGVRFAARYSAGGVGTEVGGDWYDVVPLPGGRVGLVMGDVVGHDLQAASSMGQLRNALRACAAEGAAPDDVLQRLNRLCLTQDLGAMATVLYAVLDPVAAVVDIANAGHYPPLLVTQEGRRFLESSPCPPVGVVREAHYGSSSYALPAGSLLLLYTDGLVERRNATVDEGLARLARLVTPVDGQDLAALCDDVLAGMLADDATEDDVALLLVAPQAVLGPHVDVLWPAQAERLALLRHLLERWLTEAGATDDEVYDILVACSEAATNAIEHAYGPGRADFHVVCDVVDDVVTIVVRDWGQWRAARGQDRGRGLGLMEELMDEVQVLHGDSGTEVRLRRRLERAGGTSG